MFREMRRQERQIPAQEAMDILARAEYGTMATVNEDGWPYAVTVNHIVMDGAICFHCAYEGQKIDNILRDKKVCFTAVAETQPVPEKFTTKYESAVVFGEAELIDGDEKRAALRMLVQKFASQFAEAGDVSIEKSFERTAIVRITPVHIAGKAKR